MRVSRKALFIALILLVSFLQSPLAIIPHVEADTDTWQVTASTDDCLKYSGLLNLIHGNYYADSPDYDFENGVRFLNVNIPSGSTITSAYLKICASHAGSVSSGGSLVIEGIDENNTLTFSTLVNFDNRLRTDAKVTWNFGAWNQNIWYSSPDIKTIIQEIIDRPGWTSGNALGLGSDDNSRTRSRGGYSWDSETTKAPKLEITWTPPEGSIENKGVIASDSTIDDGQWFFLNASIEIIPDSGTFLFNRIDIDPDGLNMSCSYTNSTDTFVEENDPNNYLQLDVATSVKTDLNNTFVRVDYYLRIHPNVTKDGVYNVTSYSTSSDLGGISDLDNYTSVFTLTIRAPSIPTKLFGAGFNASSPYVELYWTHDLLIYDLFEVQNSSNNVDWIYLGQNSTAQYTDSQVVNGTARYYKVRACRDTGVGWKNSSFTDSNFETVYFVEAAAAIDDPGWLAGWDYRVKMTIDSGDVDESLTDFPVLIYLSTSSGIGPDDISFVFDEVGANGLRIAVTTSNGLTECYVEVEKWDLGYEKAWLWAKIPSISNITDTIIYLYYDNGKEDNTDYVGITNSVPAENVWDSDFLMVQHQAGASSPILDSTDNDVDMTETGDPTYQQVGPIDGEIDYDGNDYHLSAVNVFDAIFGADKGTIGLWIKTTASDTTSRIVFGIEGAYVFNFKYGEGGLLKTFWSGTHTDSARTTTQINTGVQFYVVSTYDGVNQRVYVNGVLEATDACNLYNITALTRASGIASSWNGGNPIDANIDDVRVSKINRLPSWINASYETGRDHFLDFGSEEIRPVDTIIMGAAGVFWIILIIIVPIVAYVLKKG